MKKISKQRIGTIVLLLMIVALVVVTFFTTGEVDSETYQPKVYSTPWALLPPVIAIGLALITK